MPIVAAEAPVSDGNYSDPAGTAPARTESHGADARGAQGPLRCVGCPDGLAGDNIGLVGGVAITSLIGARYLANLVYGLSLAARTVPVVEATVPAVAGAVQSKSDALTRAWEAARGAPAITKGSQVTEQGIRDAMKGAPLSSQQSGGVSLPTIQRYVDKLLAGEVAPAIRVDGKIIVDGNHRYIASRILGQEPVIQPWAGGNPSRVIPREQLPISPNAW